MTTYLAPNDVIYGYYSGSTIAIYKGEKYAKNTIGTHAQRYRNAVERYGEDTLGSFRGRVLRGRIIWEEIPVVTGIDTSKVSCDLAHEGTCPIVNCQFKHEGQMSLL